MSFRLFFCAMLLLGFMLWREYPAPAQTSCQPPLSGCQQMTTDRLAKYGFPEGTVLRQGPFAMAFDGRTRCPRWTLELLDAAAIGTPAERADDFRPDPRIPREFRASLDDYRGSGLDRGHLAAAGNYGDVGAKSATFLLSNMMPQNSALNRGVWRSLETTVRDQAGEPGVSCWVATCPLWIPLEGRDAVVASVIGQGRIAVPTHCGKTTLTLRAGEPPELRAWIVPNKDPHDLRQLDRYLVTVDQLETAAGLDFWSGLADDVEDKLEAGP